MGSLILVTFALLQLCTHTLGLNLAVSSNEGNATSPLMYGMMFEASPIDINHSGDGGLYAELVKNRAFQGQSGSPTPDLDAYRAVGAASISIDTANPLSSALPHVMRVTPTDATITEQVGYLNTGYWGISVKPVVYTGSFYVKGAYSGTFTVSLRSDDGATVFAQKQIRSNSKADQWTKHGFTLNPSVAAPNVKNVFQVTYQPSKATGGSLLFSLTTLFPPTYHNRNNGLRVDIAQKLEAMKPRFLRWGGNNLEGNYLPYRWKWNETIGPLINRPGRQGTWSYENTDGLGLIEYMQVRRTWCDDMGLEPVLGIWAGFYLGGPVISQAELGVYVQDALNEIEFLTGPVTSTYGALRAKLGYPNPWKLNYVEIGNEDDLGGGLASYSSYRFQMFFDAIKATYPDMKIMSSNIRLSPIPKGAWLDYHVYTRPDEFIKLFNFFDNMDRGHPIMVGEYAYVQDNWPQGGGVDWAAPKAQFPTMIGSAAEAVFMIGMERNADLVKMVAYAPLLQNLDGYQWTPDLVSYTADPTDTVASASYYVQKLFGTNHGIVVLPVTSDEGFGPFYWSASTNDAGKYFLKIANYNGTDNSSVSFSVAGSTVTSAKLTTLSAPSPWSSNTPRSETTVWKETAVTRNSDGKFVFDVPSLTVAVLAV
ncbi:alpha-L-arabinofuranosidase A [Choiromyces venosus 120613-1]|uniref:non-reducing end alpha-L-arabinofuranosidase n=1 Tax=Choiromyces venosus 120613-1 TaxID=1336337 RepID=A0A3N4JS71_9PEZI|nr:alpha-L-arabinofuranosidase A [Choiromyces venosus 120613-1]